MITFIPLEYYYSLYIHSCLFLVLANLIHAYTIDIDDPKNILFLKVAGIFLLFGVISFIGLRPVSGRYFGDMGTYANYFKKYASGGLVTSDKDVVFHYYMKTFASLVPMYIFFLFSAFIYIYPMYLISKRYFEEYWFYAFLMFIASFSFYTYGTNGIRNGLATSIFLWGLCYKDKKVIMAIFFLIASLFHKTILLPVLAYGLTFFIKKDPIIYLKMWLIAIPMSLFLGSIFINLFSMLGFDDRLGGYLTGVAKTENVGKTGFRWDFIFYSSFAVYTGWYFIKKRNFRDSFYNKIYGTYLICNSFWILVIRANFSNRFAYLSWFLMAIIIIYPFLKKEFFENQEEIISKVITAYFSFTYLMWLIYYG